MLARIARRLRFEYHYRVLSTAREQSGDLFRLLAGHVFFPPYLRKVLHVRRGSGLGDVLMCTPALKVAKKLNPKGRIIFHTGFPELIRGLPFIDEVCPTDDFPANTVTLTYENPLPPPNRHIAKLFGESIGVPVRNIKPTCAMDPQTICRWQERFASLPRPIVVVNQLASTWTPNKNWPQENWEIAISLMLRFGSVVEIGTPQNSTPSESRANYVDLRGKTPIAELTAVLAIANAHVGPISGPVHLAAAVNTPSVVIYGGFEGPVCTNYPGNINLTSSPPCSPCWLLTECPHQRACLSSITPEQVVSAVRKLCGRRSQKRA